MAPSSRDPLSPIDALSPVDGRYRSATEPLRPLLSEAGLIRERIRIEAQWLLHLSAAAAARWRSDSARPRATGRRWGKEGRESWEPCVMGGTECYD